jgi:hypothetical protein
MDFKLFHFEDANIQHFFGASREKVKRLMTFVEAILIYNWPKIEFRELMGE